MDRLNYQSRTMDFRIFCSWQSDSPKATNRGFIQTALERAAKAIRADASVIVEPVIERDTVELPGAPDIAATIFQKTDSAHMFVCDVTLVTASAASTPKGASLPRLAGRCPSFRCGGEG